ncbi:MAG TPA: methylated-DNA--[protein]-cysteine S-methyltransferase [Allosphingosinicella sp.]|jgi:methylated-DNA-[protein]-cysteine S-methyltransferase|nr:methylated-DNA--[protein]-cysteine S-methyltransferase [Allosphingosinicella sp.]
MDQPGFAIFDTAIGRCGIAWGAAGIVGLQLPESSDMVAVRRLGQRFPRLARATPPVAIGAAIARIAAYLAGASDDFASLALDESNVGAFDRAVYRAAQAIPAGATSTYGEIAAGLGDPRQARAVGQALGRNPWPIIVPCHRVTGADGKMGGFSAPGGRATKRKLLELEGALAADSLPLFAVRSDP